MYFTLSSEYENQKMYLTYLFQDFIMHKVYYIKYA